MLCNVCSSSSVYICTLSNEPLRLCGGCGNVQSTPDPNGVHAGWRRHGVKLTTSKQLDEVETQRRAAMATLDQLSSSMVALRSRATAELSESRESEAELRRRLRALNEAAGWAADGGEGAAALTEAGLLLEASRAECRGLRAELARARSGHREEVAALGAALREARATHARSVWARLVKTTPGDGDGDGCHRAGDSSSSSSNNNNNSSAALAGQCLKLQTEVKALRRRAEVRRPAPLPMASFYARVSRGRFSFSFFLSPPLACCFHSGGAGGQGRVHCAARRQSQDARERGGHLRLRPFTSRGPYCGLAHSPTTRRVSTPGLGLRLT